MGAFFISSDAAHPGIQLLLTYFLEYAARKTKCNRRTVRALAMVCNEPQPADKSKPRPMLRRDATAFRRKFLASLTRQQGWTAGDALDFQRDLQMYEELLARAAAKQRSRKPFEAADHPFVDRCAFLLDSSFMEKARLAASRALTGIEELAAQIVAVQGQSPPNPRPH